MSDKDTAKAILAEVVADAEEYGHGNPALIDRARTVLRDVCGACQGCGYANPQASADLCSTCNGSGGVLSPPEPPNAKVERRRVVAWLRDTPFAHDHHDGHKFVSEYLADAIESGEHLASVDGRRMAETRSGSGRRQEAVAGAQER